MKSAMNAAPIDFEIDNADDGLVVPIPTLPPFKYELPAVSSFTFITLFAPNNKLASSSVELF